uniref:tyrosine-type recombinase/integrase n=1 Tax=Flavobacterium sp. TaxID=239 RepID=UPI0026229D10
MKTRFYLRKGIKSSIHFEARSGLYYKFRIALGITLTNEKDWNTAKQRVKMPSSTPNALTINQRLATLETKINAILIEENDFECCAEKIQALFTVTKPVNWTPKSMLQKQNEDDLIYYFEFFLKHYKTQPSPYSKKVLSPETLKTFGNILSILKRFMKAHRIKSIPFSIIDRNFHAKLMEYLMNQGYSKNYIGSIIQKIKTILQYAFDEGKHNNVEFQRRYFSKMSEVVHHPYLNLIELEQINSLVFTDPQEALARDIFLIGCFSGLRIGDLTRFLKDPDFVIEDGVQLMRIRQSKTASYVFIPVGSRILKIMERHNGKMPEYLHPNTIN